MKAFGAEFLDGVQGLPTLKAFGQSRAYGRKLAERARYLSETTMRVLATSVMTRGITDCGVAIGAAAALALGVYRVSHGETTIQALLIVLMCGTEVYRPLRDLRSVLHQGMVGQSAAAGIGALFDAEPLVPLRPTVRSLAPVDRVPSIAFENVEFAYPGGRGNAHDGLTLRSRRARRSGSSGRAGRGNPPSHGCCSICSIPRPAGSRLGARTSAPSTPTSCGGRSPSSIKTPTCSTARSPRTSASAIRTPARPRSRKPRATPTRTSSSPACRRATRRCSGSAAPTLSGGQRQRLAIARALLRDAPILILDEALSSVDAENEAVIQQAIDRLSHGRTTLILAHRLSSVIGADRILVLDRGKVVETGRHAELIRRDGPYRRLMGAQAEERGGDDLDLAEPDAEAAGSAETTDSGEAATTATAEAAARVAGRATLAHPDADHRAVAAANSRSS